MENADGIIGENVNRMNVMYGGNEIQVVHLEMDDIQEKTEFRKSSIICYDIGSNPPIQVMEDNLRRVWKSLNIDKVAMVKKEMFLVRFHAMDSRDKVLEGHYFFDKKPVIMKP